jgi:hypothetical protein
MTRNFFDSYLSGCKFLTRFFLPVFLTINLPIAVKSQIRLIGGDLTMVADLSGKLEKLNHQKSTISYLREDTVSYLLAVISNGRFIPPLSAGCNADTSLIYLGFEDDEIRVELQVKRAPAYIVLEVVLAEPPEKIDAIVWGPYHTTIAKTVGEVVGVVRDDSAAIGMQVLNPRTSGGDYSPDGLCEERGSLALRGTRGSRLQAYCINRDRYRLVSAMGHSRIPVKPLDGASVTGSRIALFSCEESEVLNVIEQIVKGENLPYPKYQGRWTKKAFLTGKSYMISDFGEADIDEAIGYAIRGGFFSLYHEGPFKTWGHYEIDTDLFPGGRAGVRKCAEKAKRSGLLFGAHTLTNFISTGDRYVTPIPTPHLAMSGFSFLDDSIDPAIKSIRVKDPTCFRRHPSDILHTVMIGQELITFQDITENEPWMLLGCRRGAFGTTPSSHDPGDSVRKLIDHPYKVFFPDIHLQREIAINLAQLFNETGISHLDFDGHEGCFASGEGDYAFNCFPGDFYRTIGHEFVNGTSRSKPYYWYINTFCNWGEPWYGGFTESMQEYRISNQDFFTRNYLPNMMGWYMLTDTTTLREMEWMLARAAGYNAGFAMVARMKSVRNNPAGKELLDIIREWESARLQGAFTNEQRALLRDPSKEFHLEKAGEKQWYLYQLTAGASTSITPESFLSKWVLKPGNKSTSN